MFAIGVCGSPDDLEAYRMFVAMTREGAVEHTAYTPDPSVAVQQLLSLLYASPRGLERGVINNLLAPLLGPADSAALLDHLEQLEDGPVITRRGDVVHATTRAMDFGEKGIIHSNIPSGGGKKFVDAASGKSIGRAIGDLAIGDVVLLAGKSRRVTRITKASVQLEPAGRGATQAPRFSRERTSGAWTWLLPEALRKRGAATSTPNDE